MRFPVAETWWSSLLKDISSTLTTSNTQTLLPLLEFSSLLGSSTLVPTEDCHRLVVIREIKIQTRHIMNSATKQTPSTIPVVCPQSSPCASNLCLCSRTCPASKGLCPSCCLYWFRGSSICTFGSTFHAKPVPIRDSF